MSHIAITLQFTLKHDPQLPLSKKRCFYFRMTRIVLIHRVIEVLVETLVLRVSGGLIHHPMRKQTSHLSHFGPSSRTLCPEAQALLRGLVTTEPRAGAGTLAVSALGPTSLGGESDVPDPGGQ